MLINLEYFVKISRKQAYDWHFPLNTLDQWCAVCLHSSRAIKFQTAEVLLIGILGLKYYDVDNGLVDHCHGDTNDDNDDDYDDDDDDDDDDENNGQDDLGHDDTDYDDDEDAGVLVVNYDDDNGLGDHGY